MRSCHCCRSSLSLLAWRYHPVPEFPPRVCVCRAPVLDILIIDDRPPLKLSSSSLCSRLNGRWSARRSKGRAWRWEWEQTRTGRSNEVKRESRQKESPRASPPWRRGGKKRQQQQQKQVESSPRHALHSVRCWPSPSRQCASDPTAT
jgi:hypothetical protein